MELGYGCMEDAEGKHHLYFFPSPFKIIKIHEKVTKANHHSEADTLKKHSQTRYRENTFGLKRQSELCTEALSETA